MGGRAGGEGEMGRGERRDDTMTGNRTNDRFPSLSSCTPSPDHTRACVTCASVIARFTELRMHGCVRIHTQEDFWKRDTHLATTESVFAVDGGVRHVAMSLAVHAGSLNTIASALAIRSLR